MCPPPPTPRLTVTQQLQSDGLRSFPSFGLAWPTLPVYSPLASSCVWFRCLLLSPCWARVLDPPHRRGDLVSIAWLWIKRLIGHGGRGQRRSRGKQNAVQRLCCHCVTEFAAENCAICLRKSFSGFSEWISGGVPIIFKIFFSILHNETSLIDFFLKKNWNQSAIT